MNLQNIHNFYEATKKKIEEELFVKKIKRKKTLYKRKHNRSMEEDEIKQYKFFLFIVYSFIFSMLFIALFSLIV